MLRSIFFLPRECETLEWNSMSKHTHIVVDVSQI